VILLDTHALIWWADGDHQRLSAAAREAIDQEIDSVRLPDGTSGLLVSAISCWEVAMLVNRGRLALSLDVERWLALLAAHPAVRFLVAQARALAIPLVSADSKIRSYAHVRSLW
jgi:PIN domain nuclease of toxin-antitoxin system